MIWFLNLFMISFFNDFQQFSRSFIGWFMFKAFCNGLERFLFITESIKINCGLAETFFNEFRVFSIRALNASGSFLGFVNHR